MIVAAVSDSLYTLASGQAGRLLSARRMRLMSRLSGGCLIGGGVWLVLARQ
jgi:threonine/homoserine/homoserine lactone efflux protein